jgi:hypothetical protein
MATTRAGSVAPPAEELPRFSKAPTEPFTNDYVADLKLLDLPKREFACTVQRFDPLGALTLVQPGPYVLEQHVETVHFRVAPGGRGPAAGPAVRGERPRLPAPGGGHRPAAEPAAQRRVGGRRAQPARAALTDVVASAQTAAPNFIARPMFGRAPGP